MTRAAILSVLNGVMRKNPSALSESVVLGMGALKPLVAMFDHPVIPLINKADSAGEGREGVRCGCTRWVGGGREGGGGRESGADAAGGGREGGREECTKTATWLFFSKSHIPSLISPLSFTQPHTHVLIIEDLIPG